MTGEVEYQPVFRRVTSPTLNSYRQDADLLKQTHRSLSRYSRFRLKAGTTQGNRILTSSRSESAITSVTPTELGSKP